MGFRLSQRKTTPAFLFVLFLAAACAGPGRAAEKAPWERMVIIGASVSRGFTLSEPFGGPQTAQYALNRYLDAVVVAPHEPARNLANTMFFMIPDDMGHSQIREALTNNPTLVVGVDFLFWYCYGAGGTDADRREHFEKGLKLLESIPCPLIIGDIPDASAAMNRALRPAQFPSAKARAAANRRLAQWAAQRKQVTVVPLAAFMRAVSANDQLTVHGHAFAKGTTRSLLQADRLHPNRSGCAALAIAILDKYFSDHPGLDASAARWDPEEVLRAVAPVK
jgi:hypothetical protein